MSDITNLFLNSFLPVLLAAAAGYPLGRWLRVNPRPLSQIIFYIFSPCLVFRILVNSNLSGADILRLSALALLMSGLMAGLAWGASRLLKLERTVMMAVLLSCLFVNAGNIGLPITSFAFGDKALAFASLYFTINSILGNTVGVVIASMGSTTFFQAVRGLFRLPTVYALTLGLAMNALGLKLPGSLDSTVNLLANAAIPGMLVLMGLQIQRAHLKGQVAALGVVGVLRLVVAPLLALGLSLALGLQGAVRQAGVLESAMPSAVMNTVLSTEYDLQPTFVTSAVFFSTLLSPLTLLPLLLYLRA